MAFIKLGNVHAFPDVEPDKAQALKPLEEAAEAFGAWQVLDTCDETCGFCVRFEQKLDCEVGYDLLAEIADTIQACANLAAALGVEDLTPYLAECEERNRERGRYEGL